MKSMTGYGRGEAKDDSRSFTVEIKTINHRYNDFSIKMPKHINYLEELVKKKAKSVISRGKAEIYISMEYIAGDDMAVTPNIELAKSYKGAIDEVAKSLGVKEEISLETIVKFPEILRLQKKEEATELIEQLLVESLDNALVQLSEMREEEGKKLLEDMEEKLSTIEETILFIEKRAPEIVEEYRERLNKRIEDLLDSKYDIDESRLANEVAYFADKAGIDEELVRLKSHISQARKTCNSSDVVGRKLDFIVQEMNREANTIGSKVGDIEITNGVVTIKTEIEKIREQIQNIE